MLVDTHAHLEAIENLEEVLRHTRETGVGSIISIGTSLESSRQAINIAEKFSSDELKIYATVGMHPLDSKREIEEKGMDVCISELANLAITSKKIVGIGETGLDYYGDYDKRPKTSDDEKIFQKNLFANQIKIANDLSLPTVIHCRNAWSEIFDEITMHKLKRGVFHSFTGNEKDAEMAVELGFFVSFSGIVTFKNAEHIRKAAAAARVENVLVETDAPYLSPEPLRGQKNEPANVNITASFLANLLNARESDFYKITYINAQKAFGLW